MFNSDDDDDDDEEDGIIAADGVINDVASIKMR